MGENRLFLTEVDHHHPRPLKNQRLRAYIVQNSLFFDKLLVGDSQFNNNRHMRNLIWEKEPSSSAPKDTLADFSLLLQEGYLLPVIRKDYESLQQLREEHKSRGVEDVPNQEFIEFVEEKIGSQRVSYDIQLVSETFRNRALEAFSSPKNSGKGKLSVEKLHRVYDFILRQDKLLYKSLRDWVKQEIRKECFSYRDYRIIDRIVSGAYRHNVALSLDTNIDMPILESRDPFPVSLRFGPDVRQALTSKQYMNSAEWYLPPAIHLSSRFLSCIPVEALLYIKGSKNKGISPLGSYKRITKTLERFRSGRTINPDKFIEELALYLTEVEIIVKDCLGNRTKSDYLTRKRKALDKAKVNLIVEGIYSAIGLIPVVGDIVGMVHAGHGGLKDLRDAARQEDFINGYITGRSSTINDELMLDFPNKNSLPGDA